MGHHRHAYRSRIAAPDANAATASALLPGAKPMGADQRAPDATPRRRLVRVAPRRQGAQRVVHEAAQAEEIAGVRVARGAPCAIGGRGKSAVVVLGL